MMALFPAYKGRQQCSHEGDAAAEESPSLNWLTNSSFVPSKSERSECIEISTVSEEEEKGKCSKRSKSKKYKSRRQKIKRRYSISSGSSDSSDCPFYEDKVGDKRVPQSHSSTYRRNAESCAVKTKKTIGRKGLIKKKRKEDKKRDRYFKNGTTQEKNDDGVVVVGESTIDCEEFFRKTEEFNKKLRDDPKNDTLWLEYVQFQDKGEGSGRGIAEKKLSILEKALDENPTSELLLNEKFVISEKIFPVDKLANDVKAYLGRDSKNKVCWKWMLKCNQFSLSRMTVPGVLSTYTSVLQAIHSSHTLNNSLLDTLLECGLFLRQAGLWEHLWLLLQLYLDLNLTHPGSDAFKYQPSDDNKQKITELEDTIITCGLPLGALWLHLEHLREGVNFVGVEAGGEDPQRVVFTEDVCQLLFPLERSLAPRLVAIALTLVKVPPLPMTHVFCTYIGLDKIDWAIESSELLLAVMHNCGIVHVDTDYIASARDLVVAPQYINEKCGEREFFDFVNRLFENCAEHLEAERAPILAWQMRWWTLLVRLNSGRDLYGLRPQAKQLLKRRRDDISLYAEYALMEREAGNYEITLKVLETGILLSQSPLNVVREKDSICAAYRTLVEVLLEKDFAGNRNKALAVLCSLALGRPISDASGDEDEIAKADARLGHLTTEILNDVLRSLADEVSLRDVLSPHFAVSWLACHAWFLYLTKTVWQSAALVENAIRTLERSFPTVGTSLGRCILEGYYVILVNVVHHFCDANPGHFGSLNEILARATGQFPGNLYFLNIVTVTGLAKHSWWKPSSSSNDSTLANIFRVFFARMEILKTESTDDGDNKRLQLYNLFKKVSSDPVAQNCPLVWRLFLQFVASCTPQEIKKVFYQSVEKCPWVKSIYYGAAQILPEELSQIQDLLVEKELRLHITPEEIEILREGDNETCSNVPLDNSRETV